MAALVASLRPRTLESKETTTEAPYGGNVAGPVQYDHRHPSHTAAVYCGQVYHWPQLIVGDVSYPRLIAEGLGVSVLPFYGMLTLAKIGSQATPNGRLLSHPSFPLSRE